MSKRFFFNVFDHAVCRTVISEHPSLTDPQFARECDVNNVIAAYSRGELQPHYGDCGDVSDIGDYATCLEKARKVSDYFASLPSDVRARFGNTPQAFVAFALDPSHIDELVNMGVFTRKDKPAPVKVEVVGGQSVPPTAS